MRGIQRGFDGALKRRRIKDDMIGWRHKDNRIGTRTSGQYRRNGGSRRRSTVASTRGEED